MTRERSDLDVGDVLGAWMRDAAPASIPVVVLEESFARTMTASQVRVYPWQRVARRSSHPRRLTLLSVAATAALLVGVLGLGVFGGGSGFGPGPTPSPTPTAIPTPSPTAIPSPSPSPIPATPITPTASVAVVEPQSLATDGKVVWVLTPTGSVARIDPTTNTLGAGVQTGGTTDLYNGISVDANGVWVTDWDTQTLFRIDPTTSKVTAIEVGLAPKGVLATGSAVWVADTHDGKVYRIDPATNKIVATITVGPTGNSGPNWLTSGFGSVWVGIPNNGTVVRIDAITNAILATIPIPPAIALPCGGFAVTPTAVWSMPCDGAQAMTRIDPATNTVVTAVKLPEQGYNPAVIDGVPWVSIFTGDGKRGRLGRISEATNAVDLQLAPGATFGGGGDMVVASGSAWVIDGGNDRVLRLPLTGFPPS